MILIFTSEQNQLLAPSERTPVAANNPSINTGNHQVVVSNAPTAANNANATTASAHAPATTANAPASAANNTTKTANKKTVVTKSTSTKKSAPATVAQANAAPSDKSAIMAATQAEILEQVNEEQATLVKVKKAGAIKVAQKLPKGSAWAIQMGSFSSDVNAKDLQQQLQKHGFPAFVQATKNKKTRVLVGPELDRQHAENMNEKISQQLHIQGVIVAFNPMLLKSS